MKKIHQAWNRLIQIIKDYGFREDDMGLWRLRIRISSSDTIDPDKLIGLKKETIEKKLAIVEHNILYSIKEKLDKKIEQVNKRVYSRL